MDIKNYLKKHGWLVSFAVILDFLAIAYWYSYLVEGQIHDGKAGITFVGENALGHVIGASIGALVLSYFLVKTLLKSYREQ